MTLGERIQANRKRLGMSQEQLGQQLMVSRQTVSLWEKNQTMPTIDNLVRLREIFGISVDEMLAGEVSSDDENEPLENYSYRLSRQDIKEVYSSAGGVSAVQIAAYLIVLVMCVIIYRSAIDFAPALWIAIGMLAMHIVYGIIFLVNNGKLKKLSSEGILKTDYRISVFEDGFLMEFYEGGLLRSNRRYEFANLGEIKETNAYYLLRNLNQYYIIPKSVLPESSLLRRALSARVNETGVKQLPKRLRTLSNVLTAQTAVSFFVGIMIFVTNTINGELTAVGWVLFVLAAVPACLIALGIYCKVKRYRHTLPSVLGYAVLVMLVAMGFFAVTEPGGGEILEYTRENEYAFVQTVLDTELPEPEEINFVSTITMEQPNPEYEIDSIGLIRFSPGDIGRVKELLKADERWLEKTPESLSKVIPPYFTPEYDYAVICNISDETYNLKSKSDEVCDYLAAYFSEDEGIIYTFQYLA